MSSECQASIHVTGQPLESLYARTGWLGAAFKNALLSSGVEERADPDYTLSTAMFCSHHCVSGFANILVYGARALNNTDMVFPNALSQIFNSRSHEGTHAIDFHRNAILHLTGYNPHTQFLLLPGDEIRLMEMKERNALARAWLMDRVAAGDLPLDDPWTLQRALMTTAQTILENTPYNNGSLLDYYRDLALDEYEWTVPERIRTCGGNIVFVAPDDQDWLDIGRSFGAESGLSTFGYHPSDLALFQGMPLSPDHDTRVRKLHADLNLPPPMAWGAALASRGLTRAGFLELSRSPVLSFAA